jgi:hypothetical protein
VALGVALIVELIASIGEVYRNSLVLPNSVNYEELVFVLFHFRLGRDVRKAHLDSRAGRPLCDCGCTHQEAKERKVAAIGGQISVEQ